MDGHMPVSNVVQETIHNANVVFKVVMSKDETCFEQVFFPFTSLIDLIFF
jgi:hypothetical protein